MRPAVIVLALLAGPVAAETVVAARNIRPMTLLEPGDVSMVPETIPGAITDPSEIVGREARVAIYAGRPFRPGDVGAPGLVDRNQIVSIAYSLGALEIRAEGRALGRGGVGDVIRVMNINSRTTVSGRVAEDGSIRVGAGF